MSAGAAYRSTEVFPPLPAPAAELTEAEARYQTVERMARRAQALAHAMGAPWSVWPVLFDALMSEVRAMRAET